MREGINVIVAGSIERAGAGYKILIRAIEGGTGKVLATREIDAANNHVVLGRIARLVAPIRAALGDTTPESAQVAAAQAYTAASLEAAHAFTLGQEKALTGNYPEAIPHYQQAIELDPNLGRAYVGLAVANNTLKKQEEAGEYYKKALTLVDRMSEHEKYRTLGTYYLGYAGNYEQGIEALRKLVLLYPADGTAYNNLAFGYAHVAKMSEAAARGPPRSRNKSGELAEALQLRTLFVVRRRPGDCRNRGGARDTAK
jgi:tetratricopeptide (TPR) repeat protein